MSVLIYKIDSSKLVKIGEPGYQEGQEQAKVYFNEVPQDEFTVAITDVSLTQKIGSLANVDLGGNYRILIGVDIGEPERIGLDIVYIDRHSGTAKTCVISYANCPQESDYGLANKLLGVIEDALYKQSYIGKAQTPSPLWEALLNAEKRSEAKNTLVGSRGDWDMEK